MILIILTLSDVRLLDELDQAVHEGRINLMRIYQERLDVLVSVLNCQRELFVLVILEYDLEYTLLLKGLVLILLVLICKWIDRSIELVLIKG